MAEHTEGPWEIEYTTGYNGQREPMGISAKNGALRIVNLWRTSVGDGLEQLQANAHLIAAAPELLAALEAALQDLGIEDEPIPEPTHDGSCGPWEMCDMGCADVAYTVERNTLRKQLRAALAKARGDTDE